MKKVAIVTDTTACVPLEYVKQLDIEVVPVQLIFEDRSLRDGIDITPTEFYALLRRESESMKKSRATRRRTRPQAGPTARK